MTRRKFLLAMAVVVLAAMTIVAKDKPKEEGFVRLFPKDGVPEGWLVRTWSDVNIPAEPSVKWTVKDGILNGSARGTWLISKQQYSDFILKFDFKLDPLGNSGCALHAPLFGDPAFDGMELQMADYRYNTSAKDSELTGGIYRAIAPLKQVYKPTEWNSYVVSLKGSHLHVTLNGVVIHDLDFSEQDQLVLRHENRTRWYCGITASPLRSSRIGRERDTSAFRNSAVASSKSRFATPGSRCWISRQSPRQSKKRT